MPEKPTATVGKIKALSGILAAAAALLAALGQIADKLPEALEKFQKTSPSIWWALLALLLLLGLWLLRDAFSKRSRLLKPEAFILRATNHKHLKGRQEDVELIYRLCEQHPIVFIEGESGTGKTALIMSGLIPIVNERRNMLPLYLNISGADWVETPASSLAAALTQALSPDERKLAGLSAPAVSPTTTTQVIRTIKQKLGRTPLLIFDQFDDYQTAHRSKFLSGSTWLNGRQLMAANPFWKSIDKLLNDSIVRCVFATRSDMAAGLDSVRFGEGKTYRLDRLQTQYVYPLLQEITQSADAAEEIVANPDQGWQRLKERLARDLAAEGLVLPIQMKVVLQGLATFNALTVGNYEKAGGLRGIESVYVRENVSRATRQSGLASAQIIALLMDLVDVEREKTVPRPVAHLLRTVADIPMNERRDLEKCLTTALEILEQREILRRRVDPASATDVWVLDHDYLCRGILVSHRQANFWNLVIQERHSSFMNAGHHPWAQWKALLTLRSQIILLYQRLFGTFRYGKHRGFALLSLLAATPYVAVAALAAAVVDSEIARRGGENAKAIVATIGQSEYSLTPSEIEAIHTLSKSDTLVRQSFLAQGMSNPDTARRIYRRLDVILNAAIGLDPGKTERKKLFEKTLMPAVRSNQSSVDTQALSLAIWSSLNESTYDKDLAGFAKERFTKFALQDLYPSAYGSGDTVVASRIVRKLGSSDASQAVTSLLEEVIARPHVTQKWGALPGLVSTFGSYLPDDAVNRIANLLNSAIEKRGDPNDVANAAKALAAFGERAPAAHLQTMAAKLTSHMAGTSYHGYLRPMAEGLHALGERVPPEYFQKGSEAIIAALDKWTITSSGDTYDAGELAAALGVIGARLDAKHAQMAAVVIMATIDRVPDPYGLRRKPLVKSLGTVVDRLDGSERRRAAQVLFAAINRDLRGHNEYLEAANLGIGNFARGLDPEHQQRAANLLLEAMGKRRLNLDQLAAELSILANEGKIDRAFSSKAQRLLLEQMQAIFARDLLKTDLGNLYAQELPRLASGWRSLVGPEHATQDVQALVMSISAAMQNELRAYNLPHLAIAIRILAGEHSTADLQKLADQLVGRMEKTDELKAGPLPPSLDLMNALTELARWMRKDQLVVVLCAPLCIGHCRSSVLLELERRIAQKFHGNPWEFVDWAHSTKRDAEFQLNCARRAGSS